MAIITCKNCGNQISDKAETCPRCGMPQTPEPVPQRSAGKTKAIILGICAAVALTLVLLVVLVFLRSSPAEDNSEERVADATQAVVDDPQSAGITQIQGDVPAGGFQDSSSGAATAEPVWTLPPTPPPELQAELEESDFTPSHIAMLCVKCIENVAMNKYDVDILVDGEMIATLEHGGDGAYMLSLEEGSHDLEFRINGKTIGGHDIYSPDDPDTFYATSFTVSGNGNLTFVVKLTAGNSITVEAI